MVCPMVGTKTTVSIRFRRMMPMKIPTMTDSLTLKNIRITLCHKIPILIVIPFLIATTTAPQSPMPASRISMQTELGMHAMTTPFIRIISIGILKTALVTGVLTMASGKLARPQPVREHVTAAASVPARF